MSINEQNLTHVYVGNTANKVEVIDDAGTVLTTLITDANKVIRIKNTLADGSVRYSPFFKFGEMFNKAKLDTTPLVEQVSYLGYNGTAGAMDATADKYFGVKVVLDHQFGIGNNSPIIKTIPFYSTVASQEHIATGLMESAIAQFKRDAQRFIKFDRVTDATLTELTSDASVVYGGTTVTSTAHGLSAGDYISLRGATYKVASATTNALELDLPYQGVTETIAVATTVDQAAAAASITNWGIRMVGITPVSGFKPVVDEPYVVRFTVQAPEFETATVTNDTLPELGSGTYQQIAALEAYAQFHDRDRTVQTYPPTERIIEAISTNTYDVLGFSAVDKVYASATTGINPHSIFSFVLAFEASLDYDDVATVLGI